MDTIRRSHPSPVRSYLTLITVALALAAALVAGGAAPVTAAPTCVTPTADYTNLLEGSGYATQQELNLSCAAVATGSVTLTCAETAAMYDGILAGSGYASVETGGAACGEPDVPVVQVENEPVARTGARPS